MKVEIVNETTWQGKTHRAGATVALPDNEARELIFLGAAKPAKGVTSQVSQKAVDAVVQQSEPVAPATPNPKG